MWRTGVPNVTVSKMDLAWKGNFERYLTCNFKLFAKPGISRRYT